MSKFVGCVILADCRPQLRLIRVMFDDEKCVKMWHNFLRLPVKLSFLLAQPDRLIILRPDLKHENGIFIFPFFLISLSEWASRGEIKESSFGRCNGQVVLVVGGCDGG